LVGAGQLRGINRYRFVDCAPHIPGESQGEFAMIAIFGLPLLSRLSLKLVQAVLFE
jgi:hypothetical protein